MCSFIASLIHSLKKHLSSIVLLQYARHSATECRDEPNTISAFSKHISILCTLALLVSLLQMLSSLSIFFTKDHDI